MDMMSLRRRVMVNQNKLMTATGNPITFNTSLTKPLKECVVRFTPQQEGSGTPSPENVREIVGKNGITVYQRGDDGVTHETSVSFPAVGKNLFDGEWRKGRYVDGVWTNSNTWRTSELIPVEPNTTYCVSVNEPRTIGKIYSNLFDKNGNHIGYDYGTSVTTTADTALMTICNTNNVVSAWTDIQLEKGSTATAYEPFDNTVYGGYVDLVNGEVVAEWAEWIEDGSRNIPYWPWSKSTDGNSVFALFNGLPSDVQRIVTVTDKQKINLCENRSYYDINAIRNQTNPYVFGVYSVSALSYAVGYPTGLIGETKAELQAYLAEHPEKFIYKLANPIHYPLSPRILSTLRGNNVMWSDANGDLTVRYWTR